LYLKKHTAILPKLPLLYHPNDYSTKFAEVPHKFLILLLLLQNHGIIALIRQRKIRTLRQPIGVVKGSYLFGLMEAAGVEPASEELLARFSTIIASFGNSPCSLKRAKHEKG